MKKLVLLMETTEQTLTHEWTKDIKFSENAHGLPGIYTRLALFFSFHRLYYGTKCSRRL